MEKPNRRGCPLCAKNAHDKTLLIWPSGEVYCHRCGYEKWQEIRDALRNEGALPTWQRDAPAQAMLKQESTERKQWSAIADNLWRRSMPITPGDPVHRYLSGRRCVVPLSDDLRYLPAPPGGWPCMLARITHAQTNVPLSLHQTFIAPDGSGKAPIEKPRLMLAGHQKKYGVIRIDNDEDVTHGLAIAEGIESALSAAHFFRPIWSCIDAGGVATFPVLPGIECLTIFADHDLNGVGQRAAEQCANRWNAAGKYVSIIEPPSVGDPNDVIKGIAA